MLSRGSAFFNMDLIVQLAKSPEVSSLDILKYEDTYLLMPVANSIPELIEMKMFERKINQVQLAGILEIKTPKLSRILNGKRASDIQFLKAVHSKLRIDAKFLLEKA
jgi:HTH-type transcriptional regulator / antitoxin HigA